MTAADPRLDHLELLLRRQGDAARDGDADALAATSADIRRGLGALSRAAPLDAATRARLDALVACCVRNQALVARRAYDTQRALSALRAAASSPDTSTPVYGARGTFARADHAGRGFGPA